MQRYQNTAFRGIDVHTSVHTTIPYQSLVWTIIRRSCYNRRMALYNHPETPEQYKGFGFSTKPNSPWIQLLLTIDGKRYPFSTGTADYREAMAFRAQKENELMTGEIAKKSKGTMNDIFDAYIAYLEDKEAKAKNDYKRSGTPTSKKMRSPINCHLKPFFGKMKISEVKTRIDAYDKRRQDQGASAPALNGEWRILSAALNRGLVKGTVSRNDIPVKYPFRHAEEKDAARTGTISEEQYTRILAALAPHLKPVFAVACETGMRPKEIRFIRPVQVFLDDENPRIELRKGETKTGKSRTVPLIQSDVIEILKTWREARDKSSEWFFQSDDGLQLGDFKKGWQAALRRSGVTGVMFYDSRRTARTNLDDADVSQADAKLVMGHTTDAMSERYNQSKKGLKRVRMAMAPKQTAIVVPTAPAPSNDDLRAKLALLKELFDGGLLPEAVYHKKASDLVG